MVTSLHQLAVVSADSTATGLEKRNKDIKDMRHVHKYVGLERVEEIYWGENITGHFTTQQHRNAWNTNTHEEVHSQRSRDWKTAQAQRHRKPTQSHVPTPATVQPATFWHQKSPCIDVFIKNIFHFTFGRSRLEYFALTSVLLTVTVASSPSGTLATMMPMRKMTASNQEYPRISDRMKKVTPRKTATPVMMWIKCSISLAMGV